MQDIVQVMSYHGHEELKFDPNDPADVNRIKEEIKKKMKEGYILGVGKAGSNDLEMVRDVNKLDDPEFNRFFLMKDTKKVLAAPVTGG